jgi:hypothetical protein
MYDPNAMTVGELVQALKDGGILVTVCIAGWKARDLLQPALEFLKTANKMMVRAEVHMEKMENGMTVLLSNHLKHIETDLRRISGRKKEEDEESAAGPVE